jgi:hypothetical protein
LLENGVEKRKSDWLIRFYEQKDQIWCPCVPLNEMSTIKMFLSFYITRKDKMGSCLILCLRTNLGENMLTIGLLNSKKP